MKEGYGEFIKKHRLLSGYQSQRRFAERTGISPATISRIESEIQKPEVSTLQTMAPYLTSTSLVDLMVTCGYWDKDDQLEGFDEELHLKVEETPYKTNDVNSNEDDFIKSIDLDDKELIEQFDLKIGGKSLTEAEIKGIISYIRTFRELNR